MKLDIITRGSEKLRDFYRRNRYVVRSGKNGMKYVSLDSVAMDIINLSLKNSKTGDVIAFNLPVELTCDHKCDCYSKKACYACHGCYQFLSNQALYAENLNYFLHHTDAEFVSEMVSRIKKHRSRTLFRWFTCGDIPNTRFLKCMIAIAKECPDVRFWTYTKKYMIVNTVVNECGLDHIPENLHIIFSHWMNEDGAYYPMPNQYKFPTSEFIPYGREELLNTVTYICPCSNPSVTEKCMNCSHPCYELRHGESMALVEHSTERTKTRDKAIKAAHEKGGLSVENLVQFLKSFIR